MESETWQGVMRYENDLHSEWFKRNSENLFKEEFRNYIYKKIWLYLINNFCYFTFCFYRYNYVRSVVRNYHTKDHLYIDFH